MIAELISVGTELLLGQIVNTNARFLSEHLANLGINVYFQTTVGDNSKRLNEALRIAASRADLIITTGGLGPTGDDLTKETLADFLQLPLEVSSSELEKIRLFFQKRGMEWVASNSKQAAFPPGSTILDNEKGTAPGMALSHQGRSYILLPGPPQEMEPMFINYAVPWLKENLIPQGSPILFSHVLKFMGISEAKLETVLQDLFLNQTEPSLALLANTGEIHLRLTARAKDKKEFMLLVEPVMQEIMKRVGNHLVAAGQETLTHSLAQLLKTRSLTLSTAESCTGGMLSSVLTSVPGSSLFYCGSVIAYSNEMKTGLLRVPASVIREHGAVSPEVASAMARGIRELAKSDLGIGITGIAGPGGGSSEKPVGLVYIALSADGFDQASRYLFAGDRETIRLRAVKTAQYLIYKYLKETSP